MNNEDIQSLAAKICNLAEIGDLTALKLATETAAAASKPVDSLVDCRGLTPLMRCARISHCSAPNPGRADCARHLLEQCGADPDAIGKIPAGIRALHLAAETGNEPVARLLLAAGADPNAQTTDGWSPLMLATIGRRVELAHLLLQCRANCDLIDAMGCTAADWAAKLGNFEILRVLQRDLCSVCRCEDSSVTYQPCGHRIACRRCAVFTPVCLRCNRLIETKEGLNSPASSTEDDASLSPSSSSTESELPLSDHQQDDRFQCRVCVTANVCVAFGCGHQACRDCARQLTVCHMCRRPIETRIRLYF